MTRTCSRCKETKNLDEFNFKNKLKNIKHCFCRECGKIYTSNHYKDNKDYYKKKARKHTNNAKEKTVLLLIDYFKDNLCANCGEGDPIVLDFDHIDPKNKSIEVSRLITNGFTKWSEIMVEISKCQVLCANCHRRKTAKDKNWFKFRILSDDSSTD